MLRWGLLLGALCIASPALAGNDDGYFHDNQATLSGGAVVGGGNGAGMLWYNPAGLGANDRGRVEVTASAFTLRFRGNDEFFGVGSQSEGLASSSFLTVPTALSMVRKLGSRWYGGIGSYTTRQDSFDEEMVIQLSDSDTATYRLASNIVQNNFGFGFGRAFANGRFRFGGSIFIVLDNQSLTESVSFIRESLDLDDAAIGLVDENRATLNRLGLDIVWGIQWDLADAFGIGVTVRLPRFKLKDDVAVNDTSVDAVGGVDGDADASRGRATTEGDFSAFSYPARLVLGLRFGSGNVRFTVDADYSTPLAISLTTWQQQFNVRAGLTIAFSEDLRIGFGAFTDRYRGRELSPAIAGDFYGASFGLTKRKRLAVRESGDIVFTTTVGLRYAGSPNARYRGGQLDTSRVDDDGTVFFEAGLRSVYLHEASLYLGSGLDF